MLSVRLSANSSAAAHSVPIRIKGVRRPRRLRHLSDMAPNRGSMNSARMLSSAMMMPLFAWFMPNLSVSILGIRLSYACQKAQIRKNAKPTSSVRL